MSTTDTAISNIIPEALAADGDNENKFLSFCLGEEEYGVEILRVREIIGIIDITPLPQTPEYVKGVINLRGKIIPVIELRTKFILESVEYTEATCIIVVEVSDKEINEEFQMGVVVDSVSEVLDISREDIEAAPRFGTDLNTDYIMGMGKVKQGDKQKVIILLDIDKVMTQEDMSSLAKVGGDSNNMGDNADTPSSNENTEQSTDVAA